MLLKNLLGTLDLEREQNAKKQEMILEDQNCKDTVQGLSRDLAHCSIGKRSLNETQLSKDKAQKRLPHVQEENIKLRNNMVQLIQEAEHWSVQHFELSELIKSYQKSQKDLRETVKNNGVIFQTQPNNDVLAEHELEEQVRRLKHDTYSLHLIAALLENECQIVQQIIELFKELHHQKERAVQEKPIRINYEQDENLSEAERVEMCKHKMEDTVGTVKKTDKFYRSLDVCHNKKAHNNCFNTQVARRTLGEKRSQPAA